MKKSALFICLISVAVLLIPNVSFGMGFGAYADFGSGSGDAEYEDDSMLPDFDFDSSNFGLGFQFETHPVTPNKIFSYRFQIGYDAREIENTDYNVTLDLDGICINNTFAFGGNVSENIRMWAGPQISIGWYSGEYDEKFSGEEISFSGAVAELGLAVGANVAFGNEAVILTTTIGFRGLGIAGTEDWPNSDDETWGGSGNGFFGTVGIMF